MILIRVVDQNVRGESQGERTSGSEAGIHSKPRQKNAR